MTEGLAPAKEYHRNLPQRLRTYLHEARGITDAVIDLFLLGWNGSRITIPVFDRRGEFALFKLAKDPDDNTDSPKAGAARNDEVEQLKHSIAIEDVRPLSFGYVDVLG